MAKKKSNAQIRRMQKRAAERGEVYEYTAPGPEAEKIPQKEASTEDSEKIRLLDIATKLKKDLQEIEDNAELKSKDRRSAKRKAEAIAATESGMPADELLAWYGKNFTSNVQEKPVDPRNIKLEAAAIKLQKELKEIEDNQELKSKDRRSAKRKAEAIASEEAGMSAAELLAWHEKYLRSQPGKKTTKEKRRHDPYIAFVGQLGYETTQDQLYEHIKAQLEGEFKVKKDGVKIRMLTDAKTKKSRGMAFVEVEDPELLYALLKLHQTFLDGRRINVERSAGGKKNSEARKSKISQYRKEQDEYFGEVVENILSEYKKTGELRDDELDEGVVALCKRHAGPVVRAAVSKYIEGSGRDMDNPSAYLTYLLTKFATEGIYDDKEGEKHSGKPKKRKPRDESNSLKRLKSNSLFQNSGVDMSISEGGSGSIPKIFPSARRGRGRGYM